MSRSLLGEFEQLVLLAILRLEENAYGAAILEEIETRTQRRTADAAVYIVLKRLEAKGYVSSRLGESSPGRGGRRRRYFQVQPTALQAMRASRHGLLRMWEGLEETLERR